MNGTLERFRNAWRETAVGTLPEPGDDPAEHHHPEQDEVTVPQLLAQLVDEVRKLQLVDVPSDYLKHHVEPISANESGEFTVELFAPGGWVLIPETPRDLTVYIGLGKGNPIVSIAAGQTANIQYPRIDYLTITYATDTDPATIDVYISSRPLAVVVTS